MTPFYTERFSFPSNVTSNYTHMSGNASPVNELYFKIVFSFFSLPITFFSIAGNILVIASVAKYPYLQITNNIFLCSLAIADLFVGLTAMPLYTAQLWLEHWYLGAFMCRLWLASDVLFSTASTLHLLMVSIDRYLSISNEYSFYYKAEDPTKSWRVRIMLSFVWLLSLLISMVPIFTGWYTTPEQRLIIDGLDFESNECNLIPITDWYRIFSSCISFWIPSIGMVYFYLIVLKKANYMENNKLKIYNSVSLSVNGVKEKSKHRYRPSMGEVVWKRKYKALKTLGTVITVFIACWLFFFYRYTFCGFDFLCPKDFKDMKRLEDIAFLMGYFNSAINPVLYSFTNKDFRKAFKKLLNIDRPPKYTSSFRRSSRMMIRM